MAVLPLAAWAPDSSQVDAKYADVATNVFPRPNGYGPVKTLVDVSQELPDARGGFTFTLGDGSPVYFVGTSSKLYRYNSLTTGFTDVSAPGVTYSVPSDDYWSFARFGNKVVATHVNAPPQVIDAVSGSNFASLVSTTGGANPPRARCCSVVGDTLVLFGIPDYPFRAFWSGLNNIGAWDAGLLGADFQDFPDGGPVMAVTGGDTGLVFQQRTIRRMVQTGDFTNLYQFSTMEEARGAISPWSVIKAGPRVFFLDTDGFYQISDGPSAPIGAAVVNEWFTTNGDATARRRAIGCVDPMGPRVFWAFRSGTSAGTGDQATLDKVLSYDWLLERFTLISQSAKVWFGGTSFAQSLDAMTGSIDDIYTSLDSGLFAGGTPILACISGANKLAFRDGMTKEAVIETSDGMLSRPYRSFVESARVDTDAPLYSVSIGVRNDLSLPVTWKPASARGRNGRCAARASGFFHRARITIPAGQIWKYVSGVEPIARREGEQ